MSELTRSILLKFWGYQSFRPMQEDIVDSVVSGRDTLALLPTGGGKSICFQVPAMAMDGICIVVTPLIALMKDQVQHLKKIGIDAAAIYSDMHPHEIELSYNQAVFGRLKFLYVSPERLLTDQFIEAIKVMKVNLIAVDESHCISQWGYDFRPPYLRIGELRPYLPNTPILALTATATPKVVDDIQFRLHFKEKNVFQTSYERKNVTYNVCYEADKYGLLSRLIDRMTSGSAIVYVRNRKKTRIIAEWLQSIGISATFYHAGLDAATRDQRQNLWMKGSVKVIVATNAFGMGIDKPDVRLVIHMDLPDSIEAYFQEAGRAGRDLKPSEAYLIVSDNDIRQLKDNLSASFPNIERIKAIYNALGNYLQIPIGSGLNQSYPFVMNDFAAYYNFSIREVFSALKIMEKDGFLQISEALTSPSKIFIKASREDLYRFQIEFPKYDNFIKFLLRNIPGVLSDFVIINEESIATKIGMKVDAITGMLKELERYNFLNFIERNEKPQITFLTEFTGADKYFQLSNESYKNRKEDAEKRVQSVIDFVNNKKECRSILLLRYFGEDIHTRCGKCDVCQNKNNLSINEIEYKLISETIISNATKRSLPLYEAVALNRQFSEEKVLDAIRWMLDNNVINKDKNNNLSLYNNRISF